MVANTRVVLPRCESVYFWSTTVKGSKGDDYTVAQDAYSEVGFTCTCLGYKHRPRQECKHIREAKDQYCGWDALYCDEVQTDEQKENKACPRCGGPTRNQAHMV